MSSSRVLPDEVVTIDGAIAFWSERTPEAPALISADGRQIRYAELRHRSCELVECLRRSGVARQDRVAILMPDGPAYAVALLGAMCAAIAVPLNEDLPVAELRLAQEDLQPRAVLGGRSLPANRVALVCAAGAALIQIDDDGVGRTEQFTHENPTNCSGYPSRAEDLAVISQTSGTTDRPKRVPHAHGWILRSGSRHHAAYQLGPADRVVVVSPLALSLGHWTIFHTITSGGALIFPHSRDPLAVWEAAFRHGATWLQVSAGWLELSAQALREQPDLLAPASLRFVRVTSAATSEALRAELADRLNAPILPCYASSEVGKVAAVLPPPALIKAGSVGQLIQEIQIVDDVGHEVGTGEPGEIWVRRAEDFQGYWDNAALNAETLTDDGWFRTGDVGYLDEDGFLFLTGRLKELINRGGTKIAPAAVDAVLVAHPAVREAAAFAVPDARLGEDIAAAVVLQAGVTASARELRGWMLGRLAPNSVPRRIWFVPSLPRTASGKVQRGTLRDQFVAAHGLKPGPALPEALSE